MVDKHVSFEVIELMLHDPGEVSVYPLVVRLEMLIHIFDMDSCGAYDLFVDAWQREASFLALVSMLIILFDYVSIDIDVFEVFVLGQVISERVEIDDHHSNSLSYLWGSQSDAFRFCERLPHVCDERLQFRFIGCDISCHLSEHRLSVSINR